MSSSHPIQAAIYVRMSTESQNYSTDHQRAKISEYALNKRIQIVREYVAFNRKSCKLSSRRKSNPPDEWIINEGAVQPLISLQLFTEARAERARRHRRYTLDELLDLLRTCHRTHGKVNAKIIAADPLMPDPQLFVRRLGSLIAAYDAAGLERCPSHTFVETKRIISARQQDLFAEVKRRAISAGATVEELVAPYTLLINLSVRVKVEVATRRRPKKGLVNWRVKPCPGVDFVVAARLDGETHELIDHYLIPTAELSKGTLYLKESNFARFAELRHLSLASMFSE